MQDLPCSVKRFGAAPESISERQDTMARHGRSGREAARPDRAHDPSAVLIWGVHSVEAALGNRARPCKRLLVTSSGMERIAEAARARGVRIEQVGDAEIDRRLPRDAVHQGILLEAGPLARVSLEEAVLDKPAGTRLVVVLDQITDPHNFGAILRSAAGFGATAVIAQERHSPRLTGIVAKAASGALDRIPVAEVVNIARTLDELKREGFQTLGFDSEAAYDISASNLTGDLALVMGAEGDGLRRLVRESCDRLVRLPTLPRLPSLNVSNAAAVALYEALRQRRSSKA